MDAITDPTVIEVTVMKSARVGYTKILNHTIGYHAENDPCPILVVQPTIEDAEGYSKDEIAPMIRDTPCLQNLFADVKSKNSKSTIKRKSFPGGTLMLTGANSALGFRRVSARIVIFDEIDGYPPSAGQEGDQIALGTRRADYFWNRKIISGSTPTVKGVSRVEERFAKGDQRHYYVPCPHCQHMQTLEWSQFDYGAFGHGTKEDPVYICCNCEKPISYDCQRWMIENGEWRAHAPFNGHASFFIWSAYSYSPNAKWSDIVKARLDCGDNPELLKTWVNTWLGQTWEEAGEKLNPVTLFNRRESYGLIIPATAAIVTATVDIQKDRLEVLVKAWGYDEESWGLEKVVIPGNTDQAEVWGKLDIFLQKTYKHSNGGTYPIHAVGIDTGFQPNSLVYEYCRKRESRNVFALKGSSIATHPITPPRASKRNKGKTHLYIVGTVAAKDLLFARLSLVRAADATRCPGYIHFPDSFGDEYFKQLTAEEKRLRYSKGRPYYDYYNQSKKRNEALDLEVYSLALIKIFCPDPIILNKYCDAVMNTKKAEPEKVQRVTTVYDPWQ